MAIKTHDGAQHPHIHRTHIFRSRPGTFGATPRHAHHILRVFDILAMPMLRDDFDIGVFHAANDGHGLHLVIKNREQHGGNPPRHPLPEAPIPAPPAHDRPNRQLPNQRAGSRICAKTPGYRQHGCWSGRVIQNPCRGFSCPRR